MKRWTSKQIGDEFFEFDTKIKAPYTEGEFPNFDGIFEAYIKPSPRKQKIWNWWVVWFKAHSEDRTDWLQIASHNCNFFTIEGQITFGNKRYHIYITKYHNRAMEVF